MTMNWYFDNFWNSYLHRIHFIFLLPIRGGDSRVSQAFCAVFYSDARARGAVFYSDTQVWQWIAISIIFKNHICIELILYFLSPIGAETQECLRHPARCLLLTLGHLARCFIWHKYMTMNRYFYHFWNSYLHRMNSIFSLPNRGRDSRVSQASCAVFNSDTGVCGAVFCSDIKIW